MKALCWLFLAAAAGVAGAAEVKPLRALLMTGGCCHDYGNQKTILSEGISARANVEWVVVHDPNNSTKSRTKTYLDDNWAAGFDVVLHNECYADEKDPAWLERIVKPHREGVPALVIHCAMHSYRTPTNEWFRFCGVRSHRHGSHFAYDMKNLQPEHPVMKGFPSSWRTPKEELYNIAEVYPGTIPLAAGYSPETKKDEVNTWVSTYGKGRVFGTTVGHYNHTMTDPVYLDYVTRGLLWACGKLGDDGKPLAGYGPKPAATKAAVDPASPKPGVSGAK